jgi:carbonic anhydrase
MICNAWVARRFAVEQHMVHISDAGNVTVVAILYRLGRPEPFLMQVCKSLILE